MTIDTADRLDILDLYARYSLLLATAHGALRAATLFWWSPSFRRPEHRGADLDVDRLHVGEGEEGGGDLLTQMAEVDAGDVGQDDLHVGMGAGDLGPFDQAQAP